MVCKKCGMVMTKDNKKCPYCGDWQENNDIIDELENLKMEVKPSSFSDNKQDSPKISQVPSIDVSGIINDLETLKVRETHKLDFDINNVKTMNAYII